MIERYFKMICAIKQLGFGKPNRSENNYHPGLFVSHIFLKSGLCHTAGSHTGDTGSANGGREEQWARDLMVAFSETWAKELLPIV